MFGVAAAATEPSGARAYRESGIALPGTIDSRLFGFGFFDVLGLNKGRGRTQRKKRQRQAWALVNSASAGAGAWRGSSARRGGLRLRGHSRATADAAGAEVNGVVEGAIQIRYRPKRRAPPGRR